MRQIGLVVALAVAIAAALVAFTITGGDSGGPLNPIAQAAERTASHPGARTTLEATFSSSMLPEPMQMQGRGVFNGETGEGRMSVTADLAGMGSFRVDAISTENAIYLGSSLFASSLPAGKTWMKLTGEFGGGHAAAFSQSDARSQLDLLRATGDDFAILGSERVRGVLATHYRAAFEYSALADELRAQGNDDAAEQIEEAGPLLGTEFPIDVWIDRRDLIHRMTFSMPFNSVEGEQASMTMSMDFFDFGIAPEIVPPPAGSIFDATALAQESLEGLSP